MGHGVSYIGSPLKHSNAPYRARTQHTYPTPLRRSSPLVSSLSHRSDSEPDISADSEDYLADSALGPDRSTVMRLQKTLDKQTATIEERDKTIRSLRNKLANAEKTIEGLWKQQSSLEAYNNFLRTENDRFTDSLLELRKERDMLEQKSCAFATPTSEWLGVGIDPSMKSFLRDACHSEFHKELLLATASQVDLAMRIIDAMQEVCSSHLPIVVIKLSNGHLRS